MHRSLDGQEGTDTTDLGEIKLVRLELTEVLHGKYCSSKTLIETSILKLQILKLHGNRTHSITTARDMKINLNECVGPFNVIFKITV